VNIASTAACRAYPPGIANCIASKFGVRVLSVAATLIVDAGDLAG